MSRRNKGSEHPSAGTLLLHLEGDLPRSESAGVQRHLVDCWECRAALEALQRGIYQFVSYRQEALADLAPPSAPCEALRTDSAPVELTSELPVSPCARPRGRRQFLRLNPALASAACLAMAAAAMTAWLVFLLARPQPISAAYFFEKARLANDAPIPPRTIVSQRVQLRQGSRVLEAEVVRGGTAHARKVTSADEEWNRVLRKLPVDWLDPLGVRSFERWHAAQTEATNSIQEDPDSITFVASSRSEGTYVRAASLTVRRADWHTVAKTFEMQGEPLVEIREVSYLVREEPVLTARAEVTPPPAVVRTPIVEDQPPGPSPAELERVEIRVRQTLHRLGADKLEAPTVAIRDGQVHVEAITETAARRDKIAQALAPLPHVMVHVQDAHSAAEQAAGSPGVTRLPAPAYPTVPPMAEELWDRLGSMEVANNFVESVTSRWFRVTASAEALRRLAERYPATRPESLPAEVRTKVDELASSYLREVRSELAEYLAEMDGPTGDLLRGHDAPALLPATSCETWQDATPALLLDLARIQTSFRQLFVVDYVRVQTQLKADPLLQGLHDARVRLERRLGMLCTPAGGGAQTDGEELR